MTPTDFQEAVWFHVRQIPPGRVTTYGNIAKALGKPGARQAVGEAVKACPPDAPWWRVVRAGGHLIAAGDSRFAQIVMLEIEGITLRPTVAPEADSVRGLTAAMSYTDSRMGWWSSKLTGEDWMQIRMVQLYHPNVNGGNVVSIPVRMTPIYCSPPDDLGRRKMNDIDIVVPRRSEGQRLLHQFEDAISGPSGIIPIRLATGDHVGMWSILDHSFEAGDVRYSLFYSGSPPEDPS